MAQDTTTKTAARKPAAKAPAGRPAKADVTTASTPPAANPCKCGCGQTAARMFKPGHDQRHLSNLRKAVAEGRMTAEQAMGQAHTVSTAFAGKVARSMEAVARERQAVADKAAQMGEAAREAQATDSKAA